MFMRPLIYYVASSIDGYIAEPDGSFARFVWSDDVVSDFLASYAWFDTVIMGRKTYDVAYKQGITDPYPALETIVFSTALEADVDPNVEVIRGDVVKNVQALKKKDGKPIWLCGGGMLAAQLYQAGLIDKITLKLNPIILGKGIPLLAGETTFSGLTLTKTKEYDCGISLRHYDIVPS